MSPILVRPVREQFQHDRVIRLLHTRWRRRYEVGVNVAGEPPAPLRFGVRQLFPDLILTTNDRANRLHSVIEVETNESINHLEAMAQWAPLARVRAPFHLYVPVVSVEATKRLCSELKIIADEIWSYHTIGSQVRFALAQRAPARPKRKAKPKASGRAKKTLAKAKSKTNAKGARKTSARTRSAKPSKTVKRAARNTSSKKSATGTRATKGRKPAGRAATRTTAAARRPAGRKSAGTGQSRR